MSKIPCEDCITLAVCKAKVKSNLTDERPILETLTRKCALLNGFLFSKFMKQDQVGYVSVMDRSRATQVISYIVRGKYDPSMC